MSTRLLEGKICLVTGANRGIGNAIAERYAEEGAVVFANARNEGSLDVWAKQCSEKYHTSVIPLYFDITDAAASKAALLKIKSDFGRIDVLVNNAGMVTYELLPMIDFEKLRAMFEVNVIAMIQLVQLASRIMTRQKSGSIINMSSVVGVQGVKGQLGYSATKGAVISITKSAAKELIEHNIRVNAIAPGMVGTERFTAVFEEKFKDKIANIGIGRLAEPNEIANVCVFLASDLSTYVTGQVIGVDGSASF
ncbi:SDR family NAD(P)-dependent oxidoreductase [Flavobacterium cheonhonense]|uniref:SDR family NAD(P)-dependent oxidoreductase n=1 Tax=Flavobacterium cheonhonense TaxID=706185 RepID=A0ABP7TSI5_9FLAO|nr:SDR family oxidoreductase [Flavobacterium cheonhonense]PJE45286.1 MAG: 3-oxoacyl-ACP reductase [Flavobacterium sp.] [Flavobacterium sp. FEMGT703F]